MILDFQLQSFVSVSVPFGVGFSCLFVCSLFPPNDSLDLGVHPRICMHVHGDGNRVHFTRFLGPMSTHYRDFYTNH